MAEAANNATIPSVFPAVAEMEKLNSEQVRLMDELAELQTEMKETQQMNDELLAELTDKNELLIQRERKQTIFLDKDTAELFQLKLELECTEEKFKYEVDIRQQSLAEMDERRQRFLKLREENELLEQTFNDMSQELANMELQHSLTIHEMNKDMSVVRQNLEISLRRELLQMDQKYQQRAFSSLSGHFKTDIFENAKLKDEVTLQSIGIANLSLRLQKQKFDTDKFRKEMKGLNRQAFALREALAELAQARQIENKQLETHGAQYELLQVQHRALTEQVHAPPNYNTLEDDIARCKAAIVEEHVKINLWTARLHKLWELGDRLVPTSTQEKEGIYSQTSFKRSTSTNALERSGKIRSMPESKSKVETNFAAQSAPLVAGAESKDGGETTGEEEEEEGGVRIADIEAACAKDSILASSLLGLKGKESTLVAGKTKKPKRGASEEQKRGSNPGDEDAVNMVSWVINEIMSVWTGTAADARMNVNSISIPKGVGLDLEASEEIKPLNTSQVQSRPINQNFDADSDDGYGDGAQGEQNVYGGGTFDPFAFQSTDPLEMQQHDAQDDDGTGLDTPTKKNDPYLMFKAEEEPLAPSPINSPTNMNEKKSLSGFPGVPSPSHKEHKDIVLFLSREKSTSGGSKHSRVEDTHLSGNVSDDDELRLGLTSSEGGGKIGGLITGADLVESYRVVSSAVAGYDGVSDDPSDADDYFAYEQHLDDTIAVEDLLEELMKKEKEDENSRAGKANAQKPWYRFRDEAKRLPTGITTGAPSLNAMFHFDSIRPAPISFDINPPVTAKTPINMNKTHASLQNSNAGNSDSASTTGSMFLSASTSRLNLPATDTVKGKSGKGMNKASSQPAFDFINPNPKIIRSGSGLAVQMPARKQRKML